MCSHLLNRAAALHPLQLVAARLQLAPQLGLLCDGHLPRHTAYAPEQRRASSHRMAFGSHSGQRLAWRACRRVPPPSRAHRLAARTALPPAYPSPPRPGSRAARSSASGVRARPSAPSPGFPPAATPPAPRLTARARAQARPHSRTPPSPAAILALSTSRLRATGPSACPPRNNYFGAIPAAVLTTLSFDRLSLSTGPVR